MRAIRENQTPAGNKDQMGIHTAHRPIGSQEVMPGLQKGGNCALSTVHVALREVRDQCR